MPPRELREILKHVGASRRAFLAKVVKGAAFAAPVVASFSMGALPAEADHVNVSYITLGGNPGCAVVPMGGASLPSGAPPCCLTAIDTGRHIMRVLVATEVEADVAPQTALNRARLTERMATALMLLSEAVVTSGAQCAPNRRYTRARLAVNDFKGILAQLGMGGGVLTTMADEVIAGLTTLATGSCP